MSCTDPGKDRHRFWNYSLPVIDVDDTGNKGFALDYIGIRVTYTP